MAKRKKRQFHCDKCGNPCEIYKKGKKHRVLICPSCGVLATNPIPFLSEIISSIRSPKDLVIPPVGRIAKNILSPLETTNETSDKLSTYKARGGETKGERYVKMALGGKI